MSALVSTADPTDRRPESSSTYRVTITEQGQARAFRVEGERVGSDSVELLVAVVCPALAGRGVVVWRRRRELGDDAHCSDKERPELVNLERSQVRQLPVVVDERDQQENRWSKRGQPWLSEARERT